MKRLRARRSLPSLKAWIGVSWLGLMVCVAGSAFGMKRSEPDIPQSPIEEWLPNKKHEGDKSKSAARDAPSKGRAILAKASKTINELNDVLKALQIRIGNDRSILRGVRRDFDGDLDMLLIDISLVKYQITRAMGQAKSVRIIIRKPIAQKKN